MKNNLVKAALVSSAALLLSITVPFSGPVRADDFSYDDFLTQVLVPAYGYSPLGTTTNHINSFDQINWDNRSGIVTISQQDFNADGVNDCLVYRIAGDAAAGSPSSEQFWLDLYTHDSAGTINLVNSVQLSSDNDLNFHVLRAGLMSKQGQVFIYTESIVNAYLATGGSYGVTWYGYDGTSLRPFYFVGKSRGGSDMITYSYNEYTDAENYKESFLLGDPNAAPAGMQQLFPNGTIADAIRGGFQLMGLPEASMETFENAEMQMDPANPNTFPTYFNSQFVKKVFEYNANGVRQGYTDLDMNITLTDYTGLNTNQAAGSAAGGAVAASAGDAAAGIAFGTGTALDSAAAAGAAAQVGGAAAAGGAAAQAGGAAAATGGAAAAVGGAAAAPGGAATAAGTTVAQAGGAAAQAGGAVAAVGAAQPNGGPEPDPNAGAAAGAQAAAAQPVQQDYLIPDSNSRYLTDADIANMTPQQLNYARNEIYARHGRMFNSIELQQYFATRSWYHPTISADAFDDYVFNDFERTNVRTLLNREVALTGLSGGMKLDQPGYDIYAVWR